jgi:spore photoproduct lyase
MTDPTRYIEILFLDAACLDYTMTKEIRERLSGIPVEIIHDLEGFLEAARTSPDPIGRGKRGLLLTKQRGEFVKPCPCTPHYLGCNYFIINMDLNCPLDCTYCILQLYLDHPLLTVHVNTEDLWPQLDVFLSRRRGRPLRIGTGELGDSLVLDPLTHRSYGLIAYFRRHPNVQFELKTKTTNVQNLMDTEPAENIVIAWSLNSESAARSDEKTAPPVASRLEAAQAVVTRGYRVGFHFDPLIRHQDWRREYARVIDDLFDRIPASRIAWISLGALRFPAPLKTIIASRHPASRILYQEFVRGRDGKLRYFKPHRLEMFLHLVERIRENGGRDVPLYLCMESREIWRKAIKKEPEGKQEIESFLALPSGCSRMAAACAAQHDDAD